MEGDTEDSTVQVWKYKENRVDKQRSLKEKRKDIQKKKLSDTQCENNINTVADELATSENIATYR